jgi:hypothetical protein
MEEITMQIKIAGVALFLMLLLQAGCATNDGWQDKNAGSTANDATAAEYGQPATDATADKKASKANTWDDGYKY